MSDGKCAICGAYVEGGVCENRDTHPTTQQGYKEMSFKQMMYQIVNEVEREKQEKENN